MGKVEVAVGNGVVRRGPGERRRNHGISYESVEIRGTQVRSVVEDLNGVRVSPNNFECDG